MNGTDLLAEFRKNRSEDAFSGLVRRYTNLVYSVAKRRLSNGSLAQDVTQTVFLRLAKTAPILRDEAQLVGWLHRTTLYVSIDFWRAEIRRRAREDRAATMQSTHVEDTAWNELAPILDEALDKLSDADRQVILLRFFEQKKMRDLGASLGIGEDAAKMRVGRALERLRTGFVRQGVTCGTAVLGALIAEHSVEAAPVHLVAALAALQAPLGTGVGAGVLALLAQLSKAKIAIGLAVSLAVVATVLVGQLSTGVLKSPAAGSTASSGQPSSRNGNSVIAASFDGNVPADLRIAQQAAQIPVPLSLIPVLSDNENQWWKDRVHLTVPEGTLILGGIEFRIEGMIQLKSEREPGFRDQVLLPMTEAGLTNVVMASLHLLGGTTWVSKPGKTVAEIVWRYTDGTSENVPLRYLDQIRDWARMAYEEPAHLPYPYTKAVWSAGDPGKPGRWLRLYRVTIANPQPSKLIREIALISANSSATVFFIAATLDPLAPGQRPDNSLDLEPTDPVPPFYLELLVQNRSGQAVAGARIQPVIGQRIGSALVSNKLRETVTDSNGAVRIAFPSADLERLAITASHEGDGAQTAAWDIKAGDSFPISYVIKLGEGAKTGN